MAELAAHFRALSPEIFAAAEREGRTAFGIDAPSALDAIRHVKAGAGTNAFLAAMAFYSQARRQNEIRIYWQRIDIPGHEVCILESRLRGGKIAGTAWLSHEGRPCAFSYSIESDERWQTLSASIKGQIGAHAVSLELTRNEESEWRANGIALPAVDGCLDVDLGFSPSTNLLPIRRLSLEIGGRAAVRAAWVRFPELSVELLEQAYTRLEENRYLYESNDGAFRKELLVSEEGFVLEYPGFWRTEAIDNRQRL